jgi:alkylresorcinol/alkylpyrone synthase
MPTISALATAVPDYPFNRDDAKYYLQKVGPVAPQLLPVILSMYDNAHVGQRYGVLPLKHLVQPRPLERISDEYREHAVSLGRRVAADCLKQADLKATDVDFLISVSCTGWMIPSLDAYLINQLGFRRDVRRLPITELGCAGGAAALSLARQLVLSAPGSTVLIVDVELTTLTLQTRDGSMANLVSTALFGDGAAAAVVTGQPASGAEIVDAETYLFADSYDALGFDLRDGGLHMVLSKDMPQLVRARIKDLVHPMLERNALKQDQLSFAVLHPGGKKVLEAVEEGLGLARDMTQPSWDVLWNYGNVSSATVLFILQEWLTTRQRTLGDFGLLAAFGPGFTSEMLLLQWV